MPLHVPCARPGCPEYAVVDSRYCDGHAYVGESQRRDRGRVRELRPERRAARAVYDDARWRRDCLPAVLRRADGHCESCGLPVEVCGPLQGHHILGITGTDDDFDPEFVIAACQDCHAVLDRARRRARG